MTREASGNGSPPPLTLPDMMDTASLAGRIGMILCWWHDDPDMIEDAAAGVALIPSLLSGDTEEFGQSEWWIFCDALGNYPLRDRDERLEELFQIAKQGWEDGIHGRPRAGRTKSFEENL